MAVVARCSRAVASSSLKLRGLATLATAASSQSAQGARAQLPRTGAPQFQTSSSSWKAGLKVQRRGIFITTTQTPNPDSMMFKPDGNDVVGSGNKTKVYSNKYDTQESPLAAALFKVKGVKEIMLAADTVTVTKIANIDWMFLEPNIQLVMSQFFAAGLQAVKLSALEREAAFVNTAEPGTLEAQIHDILEERVRPFVQQDGGDVSFDRFTDEGVLYLNMLGACSGCPKSNVTLQHGIKNLMQHFIPEIKDVLSSDDTGEGAGDDEEDGETSNIPIKPREAAL